MRGGACRWLTVWLTTVILVAGCVSAGSPTTPSGGTAVLPSGAPTSTDAGLLSPPLSPTPSPTADPRPPLEFPDLQSHGTATLLFGSPAIPPVTFQLACFWAPSWDADDSHEGATLEGVRASGPLSILLAGEPADVWLGVGEEFEYEPSEWGPLLVIHRHGAASYVAGPTTGTVQLVEASADRTSGTLRFEGSGPRSRDRATRARSCSPTGPSRWAETRPW